MITALDTSVLLDVVANSPRHVRASLAALRQAHEDGRLVVCPVVWAELRGFFASAEAMSAALRGAGIHFDPFDREVSDLAGETWKRYRAGGGPRSTIIPDFLVAAHATLRADRLLTRDRGYARSFFRGLTLLEP